MTDFLHPLLFLVPYVSLKFFLHLSCLSIHWDFVFTIVVVFQRKSARHACLDIGTTCWSLQSNLKDSTSLNKFLLFIYFFSGRSSWSAVPPVHFHHRLRMLLVVSSTDLCCDRAVLETSQERPSNSVTQLMCCYHRVLCFDHFRWLRTRARGN